MKLEFHGATTITFDAGLLVYRELDEALELTVRSCGLLDNWRIGKNTQHSLVAWLRQSIFSRLAGYEDTNDAERPQSIRRCGKWWVGEPVNTKPLPPAK
ncbi:MAG: transposase [Verrucomicrobiota bacterium]